MHYVLLPVFNEERAIRSVIQDVINLFSKLATPVHVLVIDDGSTDGSGEILTSFAHRDDFSVLRHDLNRGIDGVFRTGIEHVAGKADGQDSLIIMEADNTNDLSSLSPILKSLRNGNDVVIASRFVTGGEMVGFPLWRSFPCKTVNWMLRRIFSVENVTDYTIFFRGYSVKLLQQGVHVYRDRLIETVGFVANAEILLKLSTLGPRIGEVPLVYKYNLKESGSKLKIPFTITQYLKLIARHLLFRKVIHRR